MNEALSISIIIPTLGREAEPLALLKSLLKQTRLPDEIIVIDQNQPRLKSLDDFTEKYPERIKHFHFLEPGVCLNYNRGLERALYEIVLFLDDDIEIEPHLIERHLKNYTDLRKIGGVAGGVSQPFGDLEESKIKNVGKYHRWTGKVEAHFNSSKRQNVDFAQGLNMSFQKKILKEIGGFDMGFIGNGYFFEPDVGLRVRAAGFNIVFDPEAKVKHLMAARGGTRLTDKAEHTYFFIKNGLRLTQKHSWRVIYYYKWISSFFYILLKAIYNRSFFIFSKGIKALF